jgi:glycosyltransferase involved in cell wall biosynthesis
LTARLAIVIGSLDLGGAERQLAQILPRLDRGRWEIDVLTLTSRGVLADELERAGIGIRTPPLANRATRPGFLRRATRAVLLSPWLWLWFARRRPDIVHFVLPEAYLIGGVCALAAGLRRKVMSRRSLAVYQTHHPVLARIERALHPYMQLVVANSDAIRRDLLDEGLPDERIVVIPNGVDTDTFRPDASRRAEVRRALALRDDALVMISVANLIPYKGHDVLFEALAKVAPSLPESWRLLCVGRDDGIGVALESTARRLGIADNVTFLGPRHDVPELLSASDLALLCSDEEGFPNAALEAMASQLPMVATRVGGTVEAVVDGVTGLLVPPRMPSALAEAALRLATDADERMRMGIAARARVEERFSLDACVSAYSALYAQILADGKAG